jgi:membrane protein
VNAGENDQGTGETQESNGAQQVGEAPTPTQHGGGGKTGLERLPLVGRLWILYRGYSKRNGPLLSAGIAYYGLFSLAPLLLLTIQISGLFVGESTAQMELRETLEDFLGPYLADLFSSVLFQLQGRGASTAVVIGAAVLLYGATKLFLRLQASFNIMWDVQVTATRFSFRRLLSRLLAFGLILAPTIVLIVSLTLNAGISWVEGVTHTSGPLLDLAQAIIPFLLAWGALIIIFTILPDIRISWRDCWLGALFTAFFCAVGTWVFGLYLSWSSSQKYAGTVGALIALIVWVDFMAIITLLGVRLNKTLYESRGKVVRPYPYAAIIYLPTEKTAQEQLASTAEAASTGKAAPAIEPAPADETPTSDESAESSGEG